MPSISRSMLTKWSNYHLTTEGRYVPRRITDPGYGPLVHYPNGTIRETAAIHCGDVGCATGPDAFKATGDTLRAFLASLLKKSGSPLPYPPPSDCIPLGRGWSFAKLIGAKDMQIDLAGLDHIAACDDTHLAPGSPYRGKPVALVGGGVRLRELASWAKGNNLSIMTSGTHLGPTIAGGFGTASHGSRLGFGGLQNMVCGMHLVTGPDSSVWIERKSHPLLSEAVATGFATQTIRDDAVFADALIHLGAMGIVNGVAVELVANDGYSLLIKEAKVNAGWLGLLAAGKYAEIAQELGRTDQPLFYEVTLDPADWDTTPAIHTMYFPATSLTPGVDIPPPIYRFADLLGPRLAAFLNRSAAGVVGRSATLPKSAFELYLEGLHDSEMYKNQPKHAKWYELHPDEITGGYPGALYNASFAVKRDELPEIVPAICAATRKLLPTFVFTIRFVSDPAGTLAFTRFAETAVIEIDGISRKAPLVGPVLGGVIEKGAALIRKCLDGKNAHNRAFDHSLHWAKLGKLDRNKVEADFGPSSNPTSRLSRWRATRHDLLEPSMLPLFRSEAAVAYGLVK